METILFLAHTEADGTLGKRRARSARRAAIDLKQRNRRRSLIVGLYGADAATGRQCHRELRRAALSRRRRRQLRDSRAMRPTPPACEAIARASAATIVIAAGTSRNARVMAGVAHRLGGCHGYACHLPSRCGRSARQHHSLVLSPAH